jgi:formylmethanofuran dehydrogenase subunit C
VSDVVTLTLRAPVPTSLDAGVVAPDRLATLTAREIAALPVWAGARIASLGDFFDVAGGRSASVRMIGDLARVHGIGTGMTGGVLTVDGDAGRGVATEMRGGIAEVTGSVGDDAGAAMSGGTLRIHGNAGARLGGALAGASKGMTGGEIVIGGSAGAEAAARARRGLVVVAGDAGERAARSMIAGTLVVLGRTAEHAGRQSKRGSIVAVGEIPVPSTYQYACTYRPAFVRFMMTYLQRQYGLSIDERVVGGGYRCFRGDAGDPGKGEILQWVAE